MGDCWLLSTCAALAKKESLLHRVLEPSQVLHGPGYTGIIGAERGHVTSILASDWLIMYRDGQTQSLEIWTLGHCLY